MVIKETLLSLLLGGTPVAVGGCGGDENPGSKQQIEVIQSANQSTNMGYTSLDSLVGDILSPSFKNRSTADRYNLIGTYENSINSRMGIVDNWLDSVTNKFTDSEAWEKYHDFWTDAEFNPISLPITVGNTRIEILFPADILQYGINPDRLSSKISDRLNEQYKILKKVFNRDIEPFKILVHPHSAYRHFRGGAATVMMGEKDGVTTFNASPTDFLYALSGDLFTHEMFQIGWPKDALTMDSFSRLLDAHKPQMMFGEALGGLFDASNNLTPYRWFGSIVDSNFSRYSMKDEQSSKDALTNIFSDPELIKYIQNGIDEYLNNQKLYDNLTMRTGIHDLPVYVALGNYLLDNGYINKLDDSQIKALEGAMQTVYNKRINRSIADQRILIKGFPAPYIAQVEALESLEDADSVVAEMEVFLGTDNTGVTGKIYRDLMSPEPQVFNKAYELTGSNLEAWKMIFSYYAEFSPLR